MNKFYKMFFCFTMGILCFLLLFNYLLGKSFERDNVQFIERIERWQRQSDERWLIDHDKNIWGNRGIFVKGYYKELGGE